MNHIGVSTYTTCVVSPQPVIIIRIFTQAIHTAASHITNVQILISTYIASKRIVR